MRPHFAIGLPATRLLGACAIVAAGWLAAGCAVVDLIRPDAPVRLGNEARYDMAREHFRAQRWKQAETEFAADLPQVGMPLLKHETKAVSVLIALVLILAAVMAGFLFVGTKVLLALPFLFCYILLLSLPVWLAAFEDDVEEVAPQLDGEGVVE